MICIPDLNPFPDPFDEPQDYWRMVKRDNTISEERKRKQLQSVGLDYDLEPSQGKESA